MKRILVPCDFSVSAIEAYQFAMNLAAQTQASVFVLKVTDMPFVYETPFGLSQYYVNPGVTQRLEQEARENFKTLQGKHPKQDGVTFTVLQGPVTLMIREFIRDHQIDLV